jgi:RNA polymerase sigma-70 factor (ECF subfamily)
VELEKLDPEDRELVLLRYVNKVPVGVLSNLFGQSRFALYRRSKHILKSLQNALE